MFQHFVQISLRTQEFWVDDRSLFVHCNCSYNLERAIRGGGGGSTPEIHVDPRM